MSEEDDVANLEFVSLSWKLIEWKVAYYHPELVHATRRSDYEVSDEVYDESERRYLTLCRELGQPNTVVHKCHPGFEDIPMDAAMMEVDRTRPSVQRVINKLSSSKKRKRK